MLFAAACVVLWFMRMLQQPATVDRIDSFFSPAAQQQAHRPPQDIVETIKTEEVIIEPPSGVTFEGNALVPANPPLTDREFDLSAIKDNTFFRAEENKAWFGILERLQDAQAGKPSQDSVGEITYAQLIEQPEVYRGQVVTVDGTVMREELLHAPVNDIGLEQYHRLVVRPTGGGVWPIMVYSLDLPEKFPRGAEIRADITVNGIFFKNWSYSWQEGLGLAPVILAKTVEWQPAPVVKPSHKTITLSGVVSVIGAAAALATFVGWLAWRQTRRPTVPTSYRDVVISLPTESSEAER